MIERAAGILIGLFGVLTLINVVVLLCNTFLRRRDSLLFAGGGGFGAVGFLLLPALRWYAWLPLLLEPATAALLLVGLPKLVRELWRTSHGNLVASYTGRSGNRVVRLQLYRQQVFVLRQSCARAPGEFGVVEVSITGSWEQNADWLRLQFGDRIAALAPFSPDGGQSIRLAGGASLYDDNPEFTLDGIELVWETPRRG